MENSIRILIVEDSKTLRYMLVKMLHDSGYNHLTTAGSAEEATILLTKEKVDILLLDWNLPQKSGFDLLREIRASPLLAGINVIMVTTMHERKNILQAIKVGLQGYLIKPIKPEVLFEKIKEIESKVIAK
jgi:two-component system, chemotaxis family, chemotaxis protein CheY